MPRPRKRRILAHGQSQAIYKPAGRALSELTQVRLLPDELEALRLADLEGLTQAQGAERMGISRSTFQRILERAHRQVAIALVQRHALHIVGKRGEPRQRPPRPRLIAGAARLARSHHPAEAGSHRKG